VLVSVVVVAVTVKVIRVDVVANNVRARSSLCS
jgi:hypothetical protein